MPKKIEIIKKLKFFPISALVFSMKEMFMRFSKHPQLLITGVVEHECPSQR
jgi:hypothetical protein